MNLADILKDSNYKLSQFSPLEIDRLERIGHQYFGTFDWTSNKSFPNLNIPTEKIISYLI